MTPETRALLQQIGADLDAHRQVRVRIGGIVSREAAPALMEEVEISNEQQRQTGPAAGSRQRPSRRQGAAGRPRPARPAPQLGSHALRAAYQAQLDELQAAYPGTQMFPDDDGMWLLVHSAVLPGLNREAAFLVAVPFAEGSFPRAWAFWNIDHGLRWIGRRHTNFPDGSVCAFVPESGVWRIGGSLASLLDFFTVWVFRQLYLEEFKRWPGRQYSSHPFYRLIEFKDDELCDCDVGGRYGGCCKPKDLAHDLTALKVGFEAKMGCRITDRVPPARVVSFMNGTAPLPGIRDLLGLA